jgi:hypothetical protein
MKMKVYSRPRGTILNKIDVGAIPDIGDVMKIVTEKFDIPPGWDWPAKPYAPPAVDVAFVQCLKGWPISRRALAARKA